MSIFDSNLVEGGSLKDVVKINHICYPNGLPILEVPIHACDTTQTTMEQYTCPSDVFYPSFPEFDTESHWPLWSDGFLCNRGKVTYDQIFKSSEKNSLDQILENAIYDGNIETLFIPYPSSLCYGSLGPNYIPDVDWWKLVEDSIKSGIKKNIRDGVDVLVFVRPLSKCGSYSSVHHAGQKLLYEYLYQNSFYITIKINSLRRFSNDFDVFWPDENDKDCGMLIGDRVNLISPVIGNPVSISVRVDMTYTQGVKYD